ncbi:hypothetical protein COOONC_25855 [Cooperia oncophora]
MRLDLPLKRGLPPKRDPVERQKKKEGPSRPIKKPSERLLAAVAAATASSRANTTSSGDAKQSKKYSERIRRKEEQAKDAKDDKESPAQSNAT